MAIIDHVQWRRQLVRCLIDNAQLPASASQRLQGDYPEQSYTECRLGRWYYGEGMIFRGHPVFQALDEPHRELHDIAACVIRKVQEGAGLPDITGDLQALKACSVELVGLLESLEDYGISQLRRLQC